MGLKYLIEQNSIMVQLLVFVLGAGAYGLMEVVFRGYTHWTMPVTGGVCVVIFYNLLGWITAAPLVISALAGAGIITAFELAAGIVVNLRLGWNVWDYSSKAWNYKGQICLAFSAVWFGLCLMFFSVIKIFS